jgi:hypothetical protein
MRRNRSNDSKKDEEIFKDLNINKKVGKKIKSKKEEEEIDKQIGKIKITNLDDDEEKEVYDNQASNIISTKTNKSIKVNKKKTNSKSKDKATALNYKVS